MLCRQRAPSARLPPSLTPVPPSLPTAALHSAPPQGISSWMGDLGADLEELTLGALLGSEEEAGAGASSSKRNDDRRVRPQSSTPAAARRTPRPQPGRT